MREMKDYERSNLPTIDTQNMCHGKIDVPFINQDEYVVNNSSADA